MEAIDIESVLSLFDKAELENSEIVVDVLDKLKSRHSLSNLQMILILVGVTALKSKRNVSCLYI